MNVNKITFRKSPSECVREIKAWKMRSVINLHVIFAPNYGIII